MCFVTMATVGYGDYYPKTHLGRFTGVGVCLIGMVSVSLFVVFLQQFIEFNPKEQKYYSECNRQKIMNEHTKKAVDLIA
jgi:hypothetical protein